MFSAAVAALLGGARTLQVLAAIFPVAASSDTLKASPAALNKDVNQLECYRRQKCQNNTAFLSGLPICRLCRIADTISSVFQSINQSINQLKT